MAARRPSFYEYLVGLGLAPKTVRNYQAAVRRAQAWCAKRGCELRSADAVAVADYAATLPNTYATRNVLRSALRRYWEWQGRRTPPLGAVRVPTKPRGRWRGLEDDQADAIARRLLERRDDHALAVALALFMGVRRSEIAAVRVEDFRQGGWLDIVGKGDVSADLPVHPVVQELAAGLLEGRRRGFVFPGGVGGHVGPSTVWEWVRHFAYDAGQGLVSTHRYRHTSVNKVYENTGDLTMAQRFARHASQETTLRYIRVRGDRLRAAVEGVRYDDAARPRDVVPVAS